MQRLAMTDDTAFDQFLESLERVLPLVEKGFDENGSFDSISLESRLCARGYRYSTFKCRVSAQRTTIEFSVVNHFTFRIPTVFAWAYSDRGEPMELSELHALLLEMHANSTRSNGTSDRSSSLQQEREDGVEGEEAKLLAYDLEEHPLSGRLSLSIHHCALTSIPVFSVSGSSSLEANIGGGGEEGAYRDVDMSTYVASWLSLFGPFIGCKVSPAMFTGVIAQLNS